MLFFRGGLGTGDDFYVDDDVVAANDRLGIFRIGLHGGDQFNAVQIGLSSSVFETSFDANEL